MKLSAKTMYIIIGIVFLIFMFGNEGSRKLVRRYWELYTLGQEIAQLKRENESLRREVYLLENDRSYIEHIARKELGVVAPDEVEYRFEKDK